MIIARLGFSNEQRKVFFFEAFFVASGLRRRLVLCGLCFLLLLACGGCEKIGVAIVESWDEK